MRWKTNFFVCHVDGLSHDRIVWVILYIWCSPLSWIMSEHNPTCSDTQNLNYQLHVRSLDNRRKLVRFYYMSLNRSIVLLNVFFRIQSNIQKLSLSLTCYLRGTSLTCCIWPTYVWKPTYHTSSVHSVITLLSHNLAFEWSITDTQLLHHHHISKVFDQSRKTF